MSFQNLDPSSPDYGRMCSEIGPPHGCISPDDAMPPNVANAVLDNFQQPYDPLCLVCILITLNS